MSSSTTPFFVLPMKPVSTLTLCKPLQKFLSTQYGTSVAESYSEVFAKIQQERDELQNVQERSLGSRDLFLSYATYLQHLNFHFPINSGQKRIKFSFTWSDAFQRKRASQGNIYYEMACALFNAAVLESQIGGAEPRKSADSIVKAVKHFLSAAGLFEFIKESVLPKIVEKITADISAEALDCLSMLMLAQAQQCVVEKSIGKMKKDSVAKLAQECAAMYEGVHSRMQSPNISALFDRHWNGYTKGKAFYYEAVANQLLAYQMNEEDEKGAEIARLYKARRLVDQTQSVRLSSDMKQVVKSFIDEIKTNTAKAHKENDKVYHDRVPSEEDLAPIERKRIAKAKIPDSLVGLTGIEDPFKDLFPVPVMEAQQKFKEELNAKLLDAFRKAREHRDGVKEGLAQQGLPGSIMTDETVPGFPDQVHEGIQKIQEQGGLNRLRSLRTTLKEMADETRNRCDELAKKLKEEEKEDSECRNQFQNSWTRLPSSQLTINLQRELEKYKGKVNQASNSDTLIDDKISKHESIFQKFESSREEIDNLMPKPDAMAQSNTSDAKKQLKELLSTLDNTFTAETDLEKQLQRSQQDAAEKIKDDLVKSQSNLEQVIKQHLTSFDDKMNEFNDLAEKEDNLFSEIKQKYDVYAKGRTESDTQHLRQQTVQRMYENIRKYDEIMGNIREGIGFYSAMQDFVEKLSQRIGDFVWARKMEKQDMISALQQQLSGVHISQQQRPGQNNPFQQNAPQQQGNNQRSNQGYHQPPPQGQQQFRQGPPYPQQGNQGYQQPPPGNWRR